MMKLLKEEILKIKSIMGLLTESVKTTEESMPEQPTPPEVKSLKQWTEESSGNVTNGKGYKKVINGNATLVYTGTFKDGILQSGVVYEYMGEKYTVVQTSSPISEENGVIDFPNNSTSWSYSADKLSSILSGEQSLTIDGCKVYNLNEDDAELWYFDLPVGFYFNIRQGVLITSTNVKYKGTFSCTTSSNLLDTFWDTKNKLNLNVSDDSNSMNDIITFIIKVADEEKQMSDLDTANANCEGNCDNGNGALTDENGNTMSGTFVGGKLQGEGTFTDKVRRFTVNGIFKDGRLDGDGTITFEDGKSYSGKLASNNDLSKIKVSTENNIIQNIVTYHQNDTRRKVEAKELPQFNLTGEVYYLNQVETKTPIPNSTLTIINNLSKEVTPTTTGVDGRFTVRLDQGTYRVDVNPNNQNFKPSTLDQVTLNQDINRRIVLNKTKKALNTPDDFIDIKAMTIFKNPTPTEIVLHEKSNSKFEYCKRFTNYYYMSVKKTGVNFKDVNKNNINNSKNFVIGCYKEYVSKYDNNMIEKIKYLSDLANEKEVFEL